MSPYESHAVALDEVQNELAGECPTFDWAGNTYKALPSEHTVTKEAGIGGYAINASLRLTVLSSAFTDAADTVADQLRGSELTYRGVDHRVTDVAIAPGGRQIEITCESASQRN